MSRSLRSVKKQRLDVTQQSIVPFRSAAGNPLEEPVEILNKASALAKKVGSTINSTANDLKVVVSVVDDIETVITDLNDAVKVANAIADIGVALSEIPVVGEVTDILAGGLTTFTDGVNTVLTPLNNFKSEVLEKVKDVIGKIYDICNKIDGYINYFATNVPVWTNTVEVLYYGWGIVSALVKILDGTAPAAHARLRDLLKRFSSIGTTVKSVYGVISKGFDDIFELFIKTLGPICHAIAKFLKKHLKPVIDGIKIVTTAFGEMEKVVHHVEDAFAPLKWALDAIEWIFEKIVQPIIDDIMNGLGFKALVKAFVKKIEDALDLNDLVDQVKGLFDPQKIGNSHTALSNHVTSVSKVHELATALEDFSSSPIEDLLAAIDSAISDTPVIPGSFPPHPPPLPPLDVNHPQLSMQTTINSMQLSLKVPGCKMKMIPLHRSGSFKPCTVLFVAIAAPKVSSSPTDWSDVTQLMNDVDAISNGLQPVLNLGGKLQQFLCKAQQQMGIPEDLQNQLSNLAVIVQCLHDLSQFLQMFPIFKPFLTPLTASLSDEIQAIAKLDTGMSQLVQATYDLSVSIKPIDASSSTLTTTINQLSNSLKIWKQQADKYCKLLQQYYANDKTKKFKPRIDAIATTFHQRIAQLQTILNGIKGLVKLSGDEGNTIAASLDTVGVQFDKLDPSIFHLEELIQKVQDVARFAAKLDAIFKPLKFMLQKHNCIGDVNDCKSGSLDDFRLLKEFASSPTVRQTLHTLFDDAMNHFFPVQTVAGLMKDSGAAVTAASTSIAKILSNYLQVLQSIENIQVGPYQFKHYNPKTKKTETINNYFFTDAEVQEILQLGKDMN